MQHKLSQNTLALKYVQKHPAIATAVFGASRVEQIKENVEHQDTEQLTTAEYNKLKQLTKANVYTSHR